MLMAMRITAIFLFLLLWPLFVTAQTRMAIMSDIHVMAPELLAVDGAAFSSYISQDRKLLRESPYLLGRCVDRIAEMRPDFVLITGDLTKDGEYVSHMMVAEMLGRLADNGISVYVVPGNHDVGNPHAAVFRGDTVERTRTVTPEEFAGIYSRFGYGNAIARDSHSLSYVAQLNDSLRLIAIDACMYYDNDYDLNTCVTSGRIRPETLRFIRRQADEARRAGCRMIAMMHHGLVRHWVWQDRAMSDYLVRGWKRIAGIFGRNGINVAFTGHFHAQDITSHGKGKSVVYDIETGSSVSCPLPYRTAALDGDTLTVATGYIADGTYSKDSELVSRSEEFAEAGIGTIVRGIVPDGIPDDIVSQAAELVAEAYLNHICGDETMDDSYRERLEKVSGDLRPHSFKYAYILRHLAANMNTDINIPDNDAVIVLPSL